MERASMTLGQSRDVNPAPADAAKPSDEESRRLPGGRMSRLRWFVLGFVVAIAALLVGGYLFLMAGGVPMETTASPLPLERTVARIALHASYGSAAQQKDPLPRDDANMVAGAETYKTRSGMPGFERTLSDTARWQVTMLVAHADALSPAVRAALTP
jgi:hypothetical protein